ncbi:MAG: ATP-binding cassette domain-containing protein [Microbacterium sp.]
MSAPSTALLDVDSLSVSYPGKGWRAPSVEVLHSVSLRIPPGKTVGLVGESGSGKTTLGRAVLGLAPVTGGTITFDGRQIHDLGKIERRSLAADLQVVFQDPYSSLNPAMSIGEILAEPLRARGVPQREAIARIHDLLVAVGMPEGSVTRSPREFSGGQRQRIAIARAIALEPKLIVCDEPTSALDLSTQARVLDLLVELQEKTGVAYLFISHNLAVVRRMCHDVAVMYRGEIVEYGDGEQVTSDPEHPYTRALLMAAPVPSRRRQADRREQRRRLREVA